MPERYVPVRTDQLQPGDYGARSPEGRDRFTVLRPHEPTRDLFGRDMIQYWCRAVPGEREGWVTYGMGGTTWKQVFE